MRHKGIPLHSQRFTFSAALFELQFVAVKKMQANKTLYKSNTLSIIECKNRIETVCYCSYPNRGTNQYTPWLVSLSRDRELAIIKKPTLRIKRSKKDFTRLRVVRIFPQV